MNEVNEEVNNQRINHQIKQWLLHKLMHILNTELFLRLFLLDHAVPGLQAFHQGPQDIINNSISFGE